MLSIHSIFLFILIQAQQQAAHHNQQQIQQQQQPKRRVVINGKPALDMHGDWALMQSSSGKQYYFNVVLAAFIVFIRLFNFQIRILRAQKRTTF